MPDGTQLPFADESFDHAYSISVLEHIGEDRDLDPLAELARVVKPGGRIVFTVRFDRTYREDWRDAPLYGGHVPARGELRGQWALPLLPAGAPGEPGAGPADRQIGAARGGHPGLAFVTLVRRPAAEFSAGGG